MFNSYIIKAAAASLMAIAAATAGGVATAQEEAAGADSVMLVLDGSGSMWGQVDGKAKIEIARGVIDDLLTGWDTSMNLGVMAYGHREKGACSDIEIVSPVAPVNAKEVMTKVNAVSPKGKTPISAAVRKAAEELRYTEDKATVILVSDGLETCNADPCALASELESSGVDFTAHVIGFDVAKEEQEQLACLAENTGGRFFSAQNAAELTTAMAETVEIVKRPEPETAATPAGPQGVSLKAKLCDTCDTVDDHMFWWINEAEQDIEGQRKQVAITGAAQDIVELPAGDYQVVARYGDAYANADISVEPGKLTNLVINMNAGNFRVKAVPTEGAEPLKDNMFYWILSPTTDLEGNRKQISISGAATNVFRLPAGEYLARARYGDAYAEDTITVRPGQLTDYTFDMNAGHLRVKATMKEGGAPIEKDMFYWVLEPEADLEGNRKQVSISGASTNIFRLPAGDYILRSRHGKSFKDTPVTVTAAGLNDLTVVHNSGRVKVTAVQTDDGPAVSNDVFWWVYEPETDLEGNQRQVDISGAAEPIFTLPAGDYVLATRYGGAITRTNITVAPGDEKAIKVLLNP